MRKGNWYLKKWQAGESRAVFKSSTRALERVRVRSGRSGTTRLCQREYNRRIARIKLAIILNANFSPGDGNLSLHYRRGKAPSPQQAAQSWRKFCKEMRRAAKKARVPFRFVHAAGMGCTGTIHHHLIVNKECIALVSEIWTRVLRFGAVRGGWLEDKRNYHKLAYYFCGQDKGENPDPEKQNEWIICGKGYSTSAGLIRPEPDVRAMDSQQWQKYPKPDEGFSIDVDSIDLGDNPVTGRPYMFYIMLPLRVPGKMSAMARAAAEEELAAENADAVRRRVDKLYARMEERRRATSP